MISFVVEKERV